MKTDKITKTPIKVEKPSKEVVVKQPTDVVEYLGKVGLVEKSAGKEILETLTEFYAVFDEWNAQADSIIVTDVSHKDAMALARKGRLALKDKRNRLIDAVAAKRKMVQAKKADIDLEDTTWLKTQQIMVANFEALEKKLLVKEEFEKRIEDARKLKLKNERIEIMVALEAPITGYDFGEMDDERWDAIHESAIQAKKDREDLAILRAKEEAETKRLASEALELKKKNEELEKKNVQLETVVQTKGYTVQTPLYSGGITVTNKKDLTDKQKLLTFAETLEGIDCDLKLTTKDGNGILDWAIEQLENVTEVIRDKANKLK